MGEGTDSRGIVVIRTAYLLACASVRLSWCGSVTDSITFSVFNRDGLVTLMAIKRKQFRKLRVVVVD